MDRKNHISTIYVLLSSLLFSIGGLCMKLIPWSALAINGIRNLLGCAVIGAFLLLSRHRLHFTKPVFIGAAATFGVTTLFTIANKLTTAANAIVLQFTAPIFVIIFMALLFGKKPSRADILTCIAVFSGVVIFFIDSLRAGGLTGNLAALLSGVCYAGVFMMNTSKRADPLSSCFIGQLAAGLVFTPFCISETDFSAPTIMAILTLGILQVGLAYMLLSLGIQHTPPVTASLISGLEPVLNPIWVALFYGELITPLALAGAIIVIGAVLLYNVWNAKHTSAEKDEVHESS